MGVKEIQSVGRRTLIAWWTDEPSTTLSSSVSMPRQDDKRRAAPGQWAQLDVSIGWNAPDRLVMRECVDCSGRVSVVDARYM